jgi:hypothetical protein
MPMNATHAAMAVLIAVDETALTLSDRTVVFLI